MNYLNFLLAGILVLGVLTIVVSAMLLSDLNNAHFIVPDGQHLVDPANMDRHKKFTKLLLTYGILTTVTSLIILVARTSGSKAFRF